MAIKTKYPEKDVQYFCTFACFEWLNLIEITQTYDAIYKWFDYMRDKFGNRVTGYVIMPNHVHVMIYVSSESKTINKLLGNGKRFLAYEIVKRLKEMERQDLLNYLHLRVPEFELKRGKQYQVFGPNSDMKPCFSLKFTLTKLRYMHNNPVAGNWNLVEQFWNYPHSSAYFYEFEEHLGYEVAHYSEFLKV